MTAPFTSGFSSGFRGLGLGSTVTAVGHGLIADDQFHFANVLPTDCGIDEGTTYYVLSTGLTDDTFQFSDSVGGTPITLDHDIASGDLVDVGDYVEIDPADAVSPKPAVQENVRPILTVPTAPALPNDTYPEDTIIYAMDSKAIYRNVAGAWSAPAGSITTVSSLPSNPYTNYTLGQLVFLTTDSKLYRMTNMSAPTTTGWSRATDGGDISPGTVTTDAIEAGAITTAKLATGAITLYDENSFAVLTPQGWAGSWSDWAALNVYNAIFAVGGTTIATGRTAALPYWTVARTGSPTAERASGYQFPGGYGITCQFAATTNRLTFTSDLVRVVAGASYGASLFYGFNTADGALSLTLRIRWYKTDGVTELTPSADQILGTSGPYEVRNVDWSTLDNETLVATAPAYASFAQVQIFEMQESVHHADNAFYLGGVRLERIPSALDPAETYSMLQLNLYNSDTADTALKSWYSGAADPDFEITAGGKMTWANDVILYRGGANQLKTLDYIVSERAAAGSSHFYGIVTGDTGPRIRFEGATNGGKIWFGSGASALGAEDTNLYRASANLLRTDDNLSISRPSSADWALSTKTSADTSDRLLILASGSMNWGPGGASSTDTNLYRLSANVLKTDDRFDAPAVGNLIYKTTNQAVARVTWTKITSYSGTYMTPFGASWNPYGGNEIRANSAGTYLVQIGARLLSCAAGDRFMIGVLTNNGATPASAAPTYTYTQFETANATGITANLYLSGTVMMRLAANDTIALGVYHDNSSGNLNVNNCSLGLVRVGT